MNGLRWRETVEMRSKMIPWRSAHTNSSGNKLSDPWWFPPRHCCLVIYCITNYLKTCWFRLTTTFLYVIILRVRNSDRVQLGNSSVPYDIDRSHSVRDFPCGPVVRNSPANAENTDSIPVWEDSTYQRATKPMNHNYWSPHALQPRLHSQKRSHCSEKPAHRS